MFKQILLLALLLNTISLSYAFAVEDPVGLLRITNVQAPPYIPPEYNFQVNVTARYAIREQREIRFEIREGRVGEAGRLLAQSDVRTLFGGGFQRFEAPLAAPSVKSEWTLTFYVLLREGISWDYIRDSTRGPSFAERTIVVSSTAPLVIRTEIQNLGLEINGEPKITDSSGIATVEAELFSTVSIKLPETVQSSASTRKIFIRWNDNVSSPERHLRVTGAVTLQATYRTQYFVRVSSAYAYAGGGGWYDEASTVTVYVQYPQSSPWPLSWLGFAFRFVGWSGDFRSTNPTLTFKVTGPVSLEAGWQPVLLDPLPSLVLVFGAAVVVSAFAVCRVILSRNAETAVPEEVRNYCVYCGLRLEANAPYCANCGMNQPE